MNSSVGVNLRVTGHLAQGGRKYMEDTFSIAYQHTKDKKKLEYAYFGIFDGHGGTHAAKYAKDRLINSIINQKGFKSEKDEDVLCAIHVGFVQTHMEMWKSVGKWPTTPSGLPSTAGTTATIAFVKRGKVFVGHVGDSRLVLGTKPDAVGESKWEALSLTQDHKPECPMEGARIRQSGGKVVVKTGVPRVVWNRPKLSHQGPVRRSTPIDEIPFLAVARSLGDFWSYNPETKKFVVSPEPDTFVIQLDHSKHKCLIFGTDGLWNMLNASEAVGFVQMVNDHNAKPNSTWVNPSKVLVDKALRRWTLHKQRADNTSVLTVMLDPPGVQQAANTTQEVSETRSETNANAIPAGCKAGVTVYSRGVSVFVTNRDTVQDVYKIFPDLGPKKPIMIMRPLNGEASTSGSTSGDDSIQSNEVSSSSCSDENALRSGVLGKRRKGAGFNEDNVRKGRSAKNPRLSSTLALVAKENCDSMEKPGRKRWTSDAIRHGNNRPEIKRYSEDYSKSHNQISLGEMKRILRSDTLAAIPFRSLRSRVVNLSVGAK